MIHVKSFLRALVIAVVATVIVEAFRRMVLVPSLGFGPKALPAILAIMLAAWFGGAQSGWIATVLNTLMLWGLHGSHIDFYMDPPRVSRHVIFFLIGGIISWGVGVLNASRRHAEQRQRELEAEILERRRAEQSSRVNAGRLQGVMDNTLAVIYVKDLQGRFLLVNKRFEEISSHRQVIGKTDADLMPADVAEQIQANDRQVRDTQKPLEFEEVVPQSDGEHTYVAVKFPIFDQEGRLTGIGGISTDITDRQKALEALEAEQDLLRHTIEAQDHERQLIAYEVHDGLIQYLTGALMQLEALSATDERMSANLSLQNTIGVLRKAVAEGRRLIDGIRTPVLDGLGVVAAVEDLIDEEERAHVSVEFVKDQQIERLDPKIEEAVYRITQEALTNIGKHSQSKKIRIELGRRGEMVHLEVRDWGKGFTPPKRLNGSVHGLRGMMERARIAGGVCHIESAPGEGTRIIAELPYVRRN